MYKLHSYEKRKENNKNNILLRGIETSAKLFSRETLRIAGVTVFKYHTKMIMIMKKFVLLIVSIFLIIYCKQKVNIDIKEYYVYTRGYNLQNNGIEKEKSKVKIINYPNSKLFIYKLEKINNSIDTLKFEKNKVSFGGVILLKIDSKKIKLNDFLINVDKYYYKDKRDYRGDEYLFLNKSNGLFFEEILSSGFFIEYDIKKYNEIHKEIVNEGIIDRKLFKKGPFEIEFPNFYKYPQLNNIDSIREDNKWRYFFKNKK